MQVDQGASIAANATANGNGGRVTVLSRQSTSMDGAISAHGGPQGGNGGFVETSGEAQLIVGPSASVSAAAPMGAAGSWLLDPDSNIDITNTARSNQVTCSGTPLTCSPTQDNSTLNPFVINDSLDNGTSVVVTTSNPNGTQSGNILVGVTAGGTDGQITLLYPTTVSLTLDAGAAGGAGSITVNSPITDAGSGGTLSVVLNAGGSIAFDNATTIAGTLTATAGIHDAAATITVSASISAHSFSATAGSAGTIDLDDATGAVVATTGGGQLYSSPVVLQAAASLTTRRTGRSISSARWMADLR